MKHHNPNPNPHDRLDFLFQPDDNMLSFKNCLIKSDDSVAQMRACGVCLLDVNVKSKDFNSEEDSVKLTYGGLQYHATCANFWVNCVDSMLPSLKLPELLWCLFVDIKEYWYVNVDVKNIDMAM